MDETQHDHAAMAEEVDDERRTGFLELFFDLVFVFAMTQVTTLLAGDLSGGGFARAGLLLGLVWWAWGIYTWAANAVSLNGAKAQAVILAAAAGTFFVAQAIPDAFSDGGLWFATAYLAVRALSLVFYWFGLRGDVEQRQALRTFLPGASIAPVIVLVGGFFDQPARQWFWAAALAIDVAGALLAGRGQWRIAAAHFSERYGLFMIIALGEAVVAIGLAASGVERDAAFLLGVGASLAVVGLLWFGYFGWVDHVGEEILRGQPAHHRGLIARDLYTFLRFPMVAGVVAFAVAGKSVVADPTATLTAGGLVALGLGISLYLLAFVLGRIRAIRAFAVERAVAIPCVAGVCLLLQGADGMIVMAAVAAVLGIALGIEWQRRPHRDHFPARH